MIARRLGGAVAGVVAAVITIMAIEWVGHLLSGAPADPAKATVPMMLWVVAAWTVGTVVGATVAARAAQWGPAAWAPAALVVFGVAMTAITILAPWWMTAAGIVLPVLIAALVSRRGGGEAQRVAL